MSHTAIGIAGTAKNTGKTTTLDALMREIRRAPGVVLALTSIGYDGESFDNVTGLPKPRITVYEGMLAAVAERCLPFSRAQLEILARTGIQTPLGEVLIGRVTRGGKLVVAGPNKRIELRSVLDALATFGATLTIVDGALNRMAPFVETDGLILATGASRHADIDRLASESRGMTELLRQPVLTPRGTTAQFGSILTEGALARFLADVPHVDTARFSGLIAGEMLEKLADQPGISGKRILLTDPIKLLLAGAPDETRALLARLPAEVGVEKSIRVLGITVNPYYPKFRFQRDDYEAAYVDKDALLLAIQNSTHLPCWNVVEQGAAGLFTEVRRVMDGGKES